ncbi:cardiolipin synthase [Bacillaceae bacterium SIJ1]|nr:phospholipase D-like domain-containing protein [Litoribacterium kuwaitense]NGP44709.1 cardiolipin synthase [Litoribacterium kuwaitense]
MNAIIWATAVICLIVILLFVSYYFGKRHALKTSPFSTQDTIAKPELLVEGATFFQKMLEDIDRAEHSVAISFFIIKDDALSRLFFSHLRQAASRGVHVYLLVDRLGGYRINKKTTTELKRSGIFFAFSHVPRLPYLAFTTLARNHRKIAVIDGRIGYLGGFNIGIDYLGGNPELGPWRDYHLRFQGNGVYHMHTSFLKDFNHASTLPFREREPERCAPSRQNVNISFLMTDGNGLAEQLVKDIDQAECSIDIGSPYFIPNQKIMNALLKALQRGVSVTLLVPKKPTIRSFKKLPSHTWIHC